MDSEEARCRSIMARAMEVARRERAPAADWQPLEKDPSQLDDFRRLTLIGSPGDAVFDHMDRTRSRIVTYPKSACTRDRAVSPDGTQTEQTECAVSPNVNAESMKAKSILRSAAARGHNVAVDMMAVE
jgi:hypothetical protein